MIGFLSSERYATVQGKSIVSLASWNQNGRTFYQNNDKESNKLFHRIACSLPGKVNSTTEQEARQKQQRRGGLFVCKKWRDSPD